MRNILLNVDIHEVFTNAEQAFRCKVSGNTKSAKREVYLLSVQHQAWPSAMAVKMSGVYRTQETPTFRVVFQN